MSISFKSMSQEDYIQNTKERVSETFDRSGFKLLQDSLESTSRYGEYRGGASATGYLNAERDNCRSYIELRKPVPNLFLMRGGQLFIKIFKMNQSLFRNILNFDTVYSLDREEYVKRSEIEQDEEIISCGEIFNRIIEEFDIAKARRDALLDIVVDNFFSSKTIPESVGYVDKIADDSSYELIAGYHFHLEDSSRLGRGKSLDNLTSFIQGDYLANLDPRIIYLLHTSKDRLRGMIYKRIMVMPANLRPRMGDREFDQFTIQYGKIIECNTKLDSSVSGNSSLTIQLENYKALTEIVAKLTFKSDDKNSREFSVKEKMQGKGHLFREEMLQKRGDNSGRSVVIHNPRLQLDELGIPTAMIPKLFRHHHISKEYARATEILESKDFVKMSEEIERLGIFEEVYVCMNRAPTLHMLGYQSYKPRIAYNKAIEVPSLVNEAFNMDYDGDTAQANVPNTLAGMRDAKELMYCMHNLYKPATGKPIVVPRLEMIYGLFMLTRYDYIPRDKIVASYDKFIETDNKSPYFISDSNYDDPQGADVLNLNGKGKERVPYGVYLWNDIYRNHIDIRDTISLEGEVGVAGKLLVKKMLRTNELPLCPLSADTLSVHANVWRSKGVNYVTKVINELVDIVYGVQEKKYSKSLNDEFKSSDISLDAFILAKSLSANEVYRLKNYDSFYLSKGIVKTAIIDSVMNSSSIEKEIENQLNLLDEETIIKVFEKDINNRVNYNDIENTSYTSKKDKIIKINAGQIINTIKNYYDMMFKLLSVKKKSTGDYKVFNSIEELKEAFLNENIFSGNRVRIGDDADTAGNLLAYSIIGKENIPILQVTSRTINHYMDIMLDCTVPIFKKVLHMFTLMSFRIGKLYSPSLTILGILDEDTVRKPWLDFHEKMIPVNKLYDDGYLDEETFASQFNEAYKEVDKTLEKIVLKAIDKENGFRLLVESGARGSTSNLNQIFTHKGRIAKPDGSAFNSAIEKSFAEQLNPLDHYVSASGSRKGILDKSVKPGETGYLQRLMWHSCGDILIVEEDCGTTEGLTFSLEDLIEFNEDLSRSGAEKISIAREELKEMIVDRYEAGTNRYITPDYAEEIAYTRESVTVRSITHCANPCCAKCYGMDLTTRGRSLVGDPIGIRAAQSIGEPGTQLVMKTFQTGGVAGKGTVGSAFDRIKTKIELTNITKKEKHACDPIAWATGNIVEKPAKKPGYKRVSIEPDYEKDSDGNYIFRDKDGYIVTNNGIEYIAKDTKGNIVYRSQEEIKTERITINDGDYKKSPIVVKNEVKVKEHVIKGKGICKYRGDHYIKDIVKYSGLDNALKYFVLTCYYIYKKDAKMDIKNFEVLGSSMVLNLVVKTDNPRLKIGQLYTSTEISSKGDLSGSTIVKVMKGVKEIPMLRESPLANIALENVAAGFARSVALGNVDELESPLRNIMLGLPPKIGSYYPNYILERKELCKDA